MRMKIAWLLLWSWVSSDVAAQLRFATEESLDEIEEDKTHTLTPVQLEPSPLTDNRATWTQPFYQLLISCEHGTLHLDQRVELSLKDTALLCVSGDGDQQKRSFGVLTTPQEAQQILSSIVYQPDVNYHNSWYGVTDSCPTGHYGNEMVRMQLSPLKRDLPEVSKGACVTVDRGFEAYSTHEKKISVASVNDRPTIEREPGQNLSVVAGGSCIKLEGFKLGDAEADAIQDDLTTVVPILNLQLNTTFGSLRVYRRSAYESGILVSGHGKSKSEVPFAPELFNTSLTMKGAISSLNEFLPEVEYCTSEDFSVVAPDTLRLTLSDNGFCGSVTKESLSASLMVPISILPSFDLGDVLVAETNITLATHLASVPLTNTPRRTDKMSRTHGLLYNDGMRVAKKLGIRLPLSFVQIDLNRTTTINGVRFTGYAHKINFTVSCTKGLINLLQKQQLFNHPVNSRFKMNGSFSTLEETLQNAHFIYSPLPNATGYDKLVFTIESSDDQATETISVVINSPMTPPALILPVTPIYAFKNEYLPIRGVELNITGVPCGGAISRGITVDITCRSGQVELVMDDSGLNPQRNEGIQIQGGSENINAALKRLRYKSHLTDTPTEDQLLFSTSWTTKSDGVTPTATFILPIKIIRRPPTMNIVFAGKIVGDHSVANTTMNTPVALQSLLIQFDDDEQCIGAGIKEISCDVTIQLSLFAKHGIISNYTSQYSPGKEEDFSVVRFNGTVTQANNFLQQQMYIPDDNFFGSDYIVITIERSASLIDDKVIVEDAPLLPVFVAAGCGPPQLFWADTGTDALSITSSSLLPYTLPEIVLFREGLEKKFCQDDIIYRATVEADQEVLKLMSSATTTASADSRILNLEGRIWDLNLAFKSVEYQFEIRGDTQIPVRANIEVHVEEKDRPDNDRVSYAYLRLKFSGNIQRELLAKVAVVGFEDTDILIGDAINMDTLTDLAGDVAITINVQNGVVYASADAVNMKANSEQRVDTNDSRQLRAVMTNLRYIPNPNFNGVDEIDFRMGSQHSILYVYVQAKNDPPELTINLEEMKDWYNYPQMFIPSVQLNDVDQNQMLEFDIRVNNGSLFLDQAFSSIFDGITVELSSSSTRLRMVSRLNRLNIILIQRLIEVRPNKCRSEENVQTCAASITMCVNDGFASVCEELMLPEQDLFYHITVPDWTRRLIVSAGSSLNLSNAFEIHQKLDVKYDLILRVHVSYGIIHMDVPSCVNGMSSTQELQFIGTSQTIYASDVPCLNEALASLELQTANTKNNITVQLELLDDKMRLITNENISVQVTEIIKPMRLNSLRRMDYGDWNASLGQYSNLTSLLSVSILPEPDGTHENELDEDILELNVSCSNCEWQYQTYIPRVSYEFAQIPSARLIFLGQSDSLNAVLATLKLAITSADSANAVTTHFHLAPYSAGRTDSLWTDSTNVSIPFTIQAPSLVWDARRTTFNVQSPNFSTHLTGLELKGKEENPSLNLTVRFECTLGQATISMKSLLVKRPCGSGDSALSLTMERSHVSDTISSTFVEMIPKDRESRVDLRLSVLDPTENTFSDAASIELHFRCLRQIPRATLVPGNISVIHVNNEKAGQPMGDVLIVRGDLDDPTWFRMKARIAHGQLIIPNKICCVDVRETKHENELDVIGPALALKNALAAVQLRGDQHYEGNDSLAVTISPLSFSGHSNVSFSVQVEVVSVHEPTITNQIESIIDDDNRTITTSDSDPEYDNEVIDLLSGFALPVVEMCENPDHTINLAMTLRETIDDVKVVPTIPLIHIEGSIEGPLSSNNWEIISLTLEIGKSWKIPGIFIGDGSGQSITCDDDLILDISAGNGSVRLDVWDGLQIDNGQKSITAVGKIDQLNDALRTLQYQCRESCGSSDEIKLRVTNSAVRPPLTHRRTIHIDQLYIVPVPRVTTSVNLYYSTEDAAFQFSDLTLNFDDNGNNGGITIPAVYDENGPIYQLEIRVSYGTIAIISTDNFAEAEQQVRRSATSHLKLEDTVINLRRDLNRLVYFSPQNWNEEQFPGGHIVEWQFVVSHENKFVESFADLVVTPRVDAPVISVPQALEDPYHYAGDYLSKLRLECVPIVCDEDTLMLLDKFSVRADARSIGKLSTKDLLVVSISVSHGSIVFGDNWRTNCISQFTGPQSRKQISFRASADCINRVLTGMGYVGEPNFSGVDQLKIRVDAGELNDEAIVPVIVIELNDAPYIEVDSVFYEALEDIPLVIDNLRLRDPDTQDTRLRVIMDIRYGQLALLKTNGVKVTTVNNALTLEGTLHNLDIAISSVVYTSAQDWNSLQIQPNGAMNRFDTITIYSTDFSAFNGSSTSVLYIYVEPTPDPVLIDMPSNAITSHYADDPPGTLRGDEDTWISAKGLAFSSADDTSRATLVVSFSVSNGIVYLPSIGGITALKGSTGGSNSVTLQGTFRIVNSCVAGLRYLPSQDFYGQDSLVVTANAMDEYTQQFTPLSSIQVAITVDAVNDAPVWNIGSSVVREIQQNKAVSIAGISIYDVDVATKNCAVDSCVMDLIVEANDGLAVLLPGPVSTQFSNDMTTKKTAYTVVSGTPNELNLLLSQMTFELVDPEFYRADSPNRMDIKLHLTVDDRGTFGWGGPQISRTTVVFNPVEWSQYQFSFSTPEGVLTLDEDTAFVFEGNLQLVDPDSERSFHNLLEVTITCTNGTFALSSSTAGVQILRNNSDEGIVIRGYYAQLNAALNGSSYIPVANGYGSEELSLSVVEINRLEKSKKNAVAAIFLFVTPVCDESSWNILSTALSMKEDEYLLIDTLSVINPDLDDHREVLVTIDVKHGGVTLVMTEDLLIHEAVYSTSEDELVAQHVSSEEIFSSSRLLYKEMVFRGRISDVNEALKGMVFQPWLNYNSDGWPVDEIVLTATSACSSTDSLSTSSTNQITIAIGVIAINDPPVLISQHFQPVLPPYSLNNLELVSSIEAVEDLPLRLESTELYDPDFDLRSGDLRLLVNISCIHCTITSEYLSNSSDIQSSDDLIVVMQNWQNDEGVQFIVHGNLPALNNSLMNDLVFQGVNDFNGLAIVVVEISDLGNYGEGGEQRSVFVLGVQVKAVNDKPQIYLPQYGSQEPGLQLDENSSVLIQGAPALSDIAVAEQRLTPEWNVDTTRSFTLQDVEAMKNMEVLTVSLNCSKGWLSLGRQCDGVKVNLSGTPDNKKAAVLTLNGSLSALNCAVEKVTYNSKPQESGEDEIYVTLSQGLVTDQSVVDDTERDSSYTVSKRMLVAIQAINDPPSISMATSFYAPVGEWVALAGIEIADPDSDDNALYVSIAVQNGRLRVTLPPRVNGGPTALHSTGDDQKLEFATTVEQGKQIFGALEYICDNANSQRDSLTIQVDDNGFTGSRGPQVTTMTAQIIVVQK